MFAFTNDIALAEKNIWSLGFSPEEQIDSVMSCALAKGYKKFGLIVPNDLYGKIVLGRSIDNLRFSLGITANTITVETLLNSPFSPGTNFLLSREALTEKLENISVISENSMELDQSSGLAQIIIKDDRYKNIFESDNYDQKAVA